MFCDNETSWPDFKLLFKQPRNFYASEQLKCKKLSGSCIFSLYINANCCPFNINWEAIFCICRRLSSWLLQWRSSRKLNVFTCSNVCFTWTSLTTLPDVVSANMWDSDCHVDVKTQVISSAKTWDSKWNCNLLAALVLSVLNIFKVLSPLENCISPFQLNLSDSFNAVFTKKKWPQFSLVTTCSHLWLCKPRKELFSAI